MSNTAYHTNIQVYQLTKITYSVSISPMLSIRLQRVGRKNEPAFRFVLTDSKNSTKSGKFLEILGSHDPRNKKATVMNVERMKELIAQGAKPSDTITNMLIEKKVITGKKINVLPKKSPIKKEGADAAAAPAAEAPKEEVKA